jgi:hypothetical protein
MKSRYSSIRSAAISDAIGTPLPTIPGFSGLGPRPAVELDPGHQELSAKDVETRRTMGHESFLRAWVRNTPNHGTELSFVNNVSGNHS